MADHRCRRGRLVSRWHARGPFGARRPHPVADVPPAALADGQAPAKGWLLALVAARPLQDAPALPMPDLARDAPALCAAILRAVGSDADLRRLQDGGDLAALAARAGALAGAGGPGGVGRGGGAPARRAVAGADARDGAARRRRPPRRWPSAWPSCATRSPPRR